MAVNSFCSPDSQSNSTPLILDGEAAADPESLLRLKSTFRTIMIAISMVGVWGNVLNLRTLSAPSLNTVPFMYIRALALFDLVALTAILLHFLLEIVRLDFLPIIWYEVWVEDVMINSFLVAGLYMAVGLTLERYMLLRKPFNMKKGRLLTIEGEVLAKIIGALCASILLHMPMALQNAVSIEGFPVIFPC